MICKCAPGIPSVVHMHPWEWFSINDKVLGSMLRYFHQRSLEGTLGSTFFQPFHLAVTTTAGPSILWMILIASQL